MSKSKTYRIIPGKSPAGYTTLKLQRRKIFGWKTVSWEYAHAGDDVNAVRAHLAAVVPSDSEIVNYRATEGTTP